MENFRDIFLKKKFPRKFLDLMDSRVRSGGKKNGKKNKIMQDVLPPWREK
jgi:hypothetical protein